MVGRETGNGSVSIVIACVPVPMDDSWRAGSELLDVCREGVALNALAEIFCAIVVQLPLDIDVAEDRSVLMCKRIMASEGLKALCCGVVTTARSCLYNHNRH